MRITSGTLTMVSSHVARATLEASRSISAWNDRARVDVGEAVKIELTGIAASGTLRKMAEQDADSLRQTTPQLPWDAQAHQAQAAGLSPKLTGPKWAQEAEDDRCPGAATSGDSSEDYSALDVTGRTWLLLIRLVGDEAGAVRLAKRLSAYARSMNQAGTADTLDAVAKAHDSSGSKVARAASSAASAATSGEVRWGYRADYSATIREYESTSFGAAAVVTTADGRQIKIATAFQMVHETSVSVSASVREGAAAKDPLVLSLNGGAPAIGSGKAAVDVDADGSADEVAALAPGSVYLVRDLNGNGLVDGGTELFGPATQDGFGELAALDADHSGWVDEGDAAFAKLGIWSGAEGEQIRSLADAGIGAIATGSAATPYSYGVGVGSLAASGVFLYEDGRAGIAGELLLEA
jgi:hypothetical protein